ncbi:MAG: hypothetical protein KAT05_15115, partial [Spirochaetes bacterium]|nr:hypothetical protein [Spirochaetota bacterium]
LTGKEHQLPETREHAPLLLKMIKSVDIKSLKYSKSENIRFINNKSLLTKWGQDFLTEFTP